MLASSALVPADLQTKDRFTQLRPAKNQRDMDVCDKCNVDKVVDMQGGKMTCPSCGENSAFETHIFETHDGHESSGKSKAINEHFQTFIRQFQVGQEPTIKDRRVLRALHARAAKIHNPAPQRITPTMVTSVMRKIRLTKRAYDRTLREVRGEPIPEFSRNQTNHILHASVSESRIKGHQHFTQSFSHQPGYKLARLFPKARRSK